MMKLSKYFCAVLNVPHSKLEVWKVRVSKSDEKGNFEEGWSKGLWVWNGLKKAKLILLCLDYDLRIHVLIPAKSGWTTLRDGDSLTLYEPSSSHN